MELLGKPAHELHLLLKNKEISSEELTKATLAHIREKDKSLNAYVTLLSDEALSFAEKIDGWIRAGEDIPPLAGIPIAIKDNICMMDTKTTCASRFLRHFVSPYDATVVKKLREQGAVIIGKTNLDEFGMGSSNENSLFGVVKNPHNFDYVSGGSSGGSAAAVAANEAVVALGSDTGGSIRLPASFCGVVGLKPTYGRVSRYGLVAFASSLDQIGPLAKDVTDVALMLQAIAGLDQKDSTMAKAPLPNYLNALVGDGLRGINIGLPVEYFVEGLHPEVEKAIQGAVSLLVGLGARCDEINLAHTEYGIPTYYLIANAEASSNLARYDGVHYGRREKGAEDLLSLYCQSRSKGFGQEIKRRIMMGTYVLSAGYYEAYYLKAQKVRTLIRRDFERAFKKFDVLISATSPTPAFKLAEKMNDPLQMYLSDIFTVSASLAGLPAISIPCGKSKNRLPIGLQIIGKPYDEETVLQVAYAFEQEFKSQ